MNKRTPATTPGLAFQVMATCAAMPASPETAACRARSPVYTPGANAPATANVRTLCAAY